MVFFNNNDLSPLESLGWIVLESGLSLIFVCLPALYGFSKNNWLVSLCRFGRNSAARVSGCWKVLLRHRGQRDIEEERRNVMPSDLRFFQLDGGSKGEDGVGREYVLADLEFGNHV